MSKAQGDTLYRVVKGPPKPRTPECPMHSINFLSHSNTAVRTVLCERWLPRDGYQQTGFVVVVVVVVVASGGGNGGCVALSNMVYLVGLR